MEGEKRPSADLIRGIDRRGGAGTLTYSPRPFLNRDVATSVTQRASKPTTQANQSNAPLRIVLDATTTNATFKSARLPGKVKKRDVSLDA